MHEVLSCQRKGVWNLLDACFAPFPIVVLERIDTPLSRNREKWAPPFYFLSADFDVDSAFGLLSFLEPESLADSFAESLLLSALFSASAFDDDPADGFFA
jgi:hypothetical protein